MSIMQNSLLQRLRDRICGLVDKLKALNVILGVALRLVSLTTGLMQGKLNSFLMTISVEFPERRPKGEDH